MRYYGTLTRWNERRRFGTILIDNSETEIFAALSAFEEDDYTPIEGQRVSFEITTGRRGRTEASHIRWASSIDHDDDDDENFDTSAAPKTRFGRPSVIPLAVLLMIAAIATAGWFGYQYWQKRQAEARQKLLVDEVSAQIQAERKAWKDALNNRNVPTSAQFSCDGRQHCSQMTSQEEARFFLRYCPNTKMDGDNDGIPCERGIGSNTYSEEQHDDNERGGRRRARK